MRLFVAVAFAVVAGALTVAGCGGAPGAEKGPGLGTQDISTKVPIQMPGPGVTAQEIVLTIMGGSHVDDAAHPSSFAVRPDLPVRVTIYNSTNVAHTFYSPELGLNKIVVAGTDRGPGVAAFAFTPGKHGVFHWRCALCPEGMGGAIYAIMTA